MKNKEPFSPGNRLKSFVHAFNGIKLFFLSEHNAWVHSAAGIAAIALGLFLKIDRKEWCLLAFAIGLVLITEIGNTAVEHLTDIASPGHSEKAKWVKDMSAGAVLIAAVVALIIGAMIFSAHL